MKKILKDKKMLAIVGTGLFLLVGVAAFVLGYGLTYGWEVVGAWFTGKYAMILYAAIAIYAVFAVFILVESRRRKYLDGGE